MRPSEILEIYENSAWRLEFDYTLLSNEIQRISEGKEESTDEKIERLKELKKQRQQLQSQQT